MDEWQRILSQRMMDKNVTGRKRNRESSFVETKFDLFNQVKLHSVIVAGQHPGPHHKIYAAVTQF